MSTPKLPSGVVHKVLNNNLIVTVDPIGREFVLMGRGLGWHLKPDDPINYDRVEKTYVLDVSGDYERLQSLLAEVPFSVIEAVTDAVDEAAGSLGRSLSRSLPVALIDHVCFVLERLRSGLRLPAATLPELMILYPQEAEAAVRMRNTLSRSLGTELPDEEAVFLAMHLINATHTEAGSDAQILLRRVNHIVQLVAATAELTLDDSSPDYARFVLHIKFLLQRLTMNAMLQGRDVSFYDFARKTYIQSNQVALWVRDYVRSSTGVELSDEEMLYLVIHIERLIQSANERRAG